MERQVGRQALGTPGARPAAAPGSAPSAAARRAEAHQVPARSCRGGWSAGGRCRQNRAMATAAPVAAETKFWASPTIWLKWRLASAGVGLPVGVGHEADRGVEGELQFSPGSCCGLRGSSPCASRIRTAGQPAPLKASRLRGVGTSSPARARPSTRSRPGWRARRASQRLTPSNTR